MSNPAAKKKNEQKKLYSNERMRILCVCVLIMPVGDFSSTFLIYFSTSLSDAA